MNFFTCFFCLFTLSFASLASASPEAGMIMISGPLIHRRVIHRRPFRLHRHRRRHNRHLHHKAKKAFIEVVNVRERIIVDEQNRPKGAEAVLSNDLLAVNPQTGQMRMLMHRELHIKPKLPTNANPNAINPQRKFIINEYGVDGALRSKGPSPWLQSFIQRFHLNSFWPLFAFSVLMGFTFVGLIFVAAKCILTLIEAEDAGYEPLLSDEELLSSVPSAQPIQLTDEMTERSGV